MLNPSLIYVPGDLELINRKRPEVTASTAIEFFKKNLYHSYRFIIEKFLRYPFETCNVK